MAYVDGFLLTVPTRNLAAYRRMSAKAGKVWKDHGALEYRECVGDDLDSKHGLPFPKVVKPRRGESIVFSWIVYKSRADRKRVLAKVMRDKRLAGSMDPRTLPFDVKRMSYGGFKVLVDL
ncbi:MAG TPA: DUF1428 domain-containing protein [Dongiaceae bacterium]